MFRKSKSKSAKNSQGCYFCLNNAEEIDYTNVDEIRRFTSPYARILPRRKTGICAKHQRKFSQAVKRARFMALLPFIKR
ncbi:MAG: 30S ribosomal protein S18 [Patescibacteria group bacterium]|nr:30S ribosomal protein S18 [Patescibacteria group bacterium]